MFASEFQELKKEYLEELPDHLNDLENILLKIDKNHSDQDLLRMFEGKVHSLKGSAGSFGLKTVAANCHGFENQMAQLKKDEAFAELVDEGFKLIDALKTFSTHQTEIYLYKEGIDSTLKEVDAEIAKEVETQKQKQTLKALIVNNSATQAKILQSLCVANNMTAEVCSKSLEGLEKLMEKHFDLCFFSANLETLDGVSLCKAIRVVESPNAKTPICLTTTRLNLRIEGFKPDFHISMSAPNYRDQFVKIANQLFKASAQSEEKRSLPFSKAIFIDDATNLHGLVKLAFKDTGAEVKCYSSGSAALADLDNFQPEVILCDMYMDDMTGVDVLQKIRERGKEPTPFIFMTAEDENESPELKEALKQAQGIIPKPINHKKLIPLAVKLLNS